jgi:hypothetical protein
MNMKFHEMEIGRDRPFIEGSSANDWESIVCLKNPGHQRAGRRITILSVDILSSNVTDFSRTMLSDVVITEAAREVLEKARLTGFTLEPVEVASIPKSRSNGTIPKLWELVITGSGGPAHKDSGIRKIRECDECHMVRYSSYKNGIVVDPSTYDGSDFFAVLEYPKHVLVSERAKAVVESNHLTNVSFIESTKLKWPEGVIEPM